MGTREEPGVELRDVSEADLPVLYEHQRDPQATHMAAFPARDHGDFMAHWAKILADDSVVAKAIVVDGHVVGNIVSFVVAGEREVGYWIGRAYWGKGFATRALRAFLRLMPVRPLHAYVVEDNLASIRVLRKCGFAVTGRHTTYSNERGTDVEEVILTLG